MAMVMSLWMGERKRKRKFIKKKKEEDLEGEVVESGGLLRGGRYDAGLLGQPALYCLLAASSEGTICPLEVSFFFSFSLSVFLSNEVRIVQSSMIVVCMYVRGGGTCVSCAL